MYAADSSNGEEINFLYLEKAASGTFSVVVMRSKKYSE